MGIYKRKFDKTKRKCFMKEDNIFDKYMKIWEKANNTIYK